MAFFTRRGNSNVPEIPSSSNTHHRDSKEEELMKQLNYRLDREGVEV